MHDKSYNKLIELLETELVPALGCTEPIAIAYASAKAREALGEMPDKIVAKCSGNIIKNVQGVIVPHTGNLRGVDASAIIGAIGGDAGKQLQVLQSVNDDHIVKAKECLANGLCEVHLVPGVSNLYIEINMYKGDDYTQVILQESHTNVVKISKNDEVIFEKRQKKQETKRMPESEFDVDAIYDFANTVDIKDVETVIERQIKYNTEIAIEGLKNNYGANVGKCIMNNNTHDVKTMAKAYSAAGSDARMAGCSLPVIINSGSGNQGMTVSLPVIKYAEHLNVTREKMIRALVFSNLLAIYQKKGIGKLSAYCGAVSAGCGAGAGISYLHDMPLDKIKMTIKNVIGNVSGIVCDGAKSSCAAKIASSVDAAIMGHEMAMNSQVYLGGEGLNAEDVDKTINNICILAKEGMKQTDLEIIRMMIDE